MRDPALTYPNNLANRTEVFMLPDQLNFHGKKLCGRSFKGRDLRGADFSGADIRGANFSNANLENATFDSVKAGLDPRWAYLLNKTSSFLLLFYFSSYIFNIAFFPLIFLIEGDPLSTLSTIIFIILFISDMYPTFMLVGYEFDDLLSLLTYRVISISIFILIVLGLFNILPKNQAIAILIYLIFSLIIHSTGSFKAFIRIRVSGDIEGPRWISWISDLITIIFLIGMSIIALKLCYNPSSIRQSPNMDRLEAHPTEGFSGTGILPVPTIGLEAHPTGGFSGTGILSLPTSDAPNNPEVNIPKQDKEDTGKFLQLGPLGTAVESMLTSLSTQDSQTILPILTKFDSEEILINFIKSIQEVNKKSTQLGGWFIVYFLFSLVPFGLISGFYLANPYTNSYGDKQFNLYRVFVPGGTNFQGANLTNADFHKSILTDTNFRGANLTNCNFSESTLKGAVFERANLTYVIWLNAKDLDKALMRGTFLEDEIVRQIVVSRNLEEIKCKNLDGKNLAGLNLIGMDLKDIDFTESDLSGALLRNANLKKANLTRAILNRVDFTNVDLSDADLTGASVKGAKFDNAILTGAILDDWIGDSHTRLWNVVCSYINVRVKYSYSSYIQMRHLKKGELANSFSTNTKLVSLPFHDQVNWKAFNYALYKFQDENNCALQVTEQGQSITDDVTTVTIAIPDQIDESDFRNELYKSYELAYNSIKAQNSPELSEVYRTLKETISHQGQDYKQIVKLLEKPRTVTYQVETMNQINDRSRKVEVHGNITGSTINLGEISGEVSNAVNSLPDSTNPSQLGIKELLTQLQKAIEEETQLPPEDKADLLEQVKALTEVPKTADQEKKEGIVRKAKKIFNATLKGLPDTAKIAEACSKLLPLILKTLGFPV
jgi:uncharacterized protein YjbI with pentapeptide repeats